MVFQCCRGKMPDSNSRSSGQKVMFFSGAVKQSGRKRVTTVTIGPCVPIILCASLAFTGLVVERKQQGRI